MRQGYKISLFFACIAVLVLIALILLKRHALYQSEEVPFIEEIQEEQDDITQVQNTDIRITCDTICMYEDFDKKDGTVSYERSENAWQIYRNEQSGNGEGIMGRQPRSES